MRQHQEVPGLLDAAIRPAREDDLAALAALSRQWEAEDVTHGLRADTEARFRKHLGALCRVAVCEGEVVGYVVGEGLRADDSLACVMAPGTKYLDVSDLYVTPAYRCQGVGTALMESLAEVARQQGARCSALLTMTKDQDRIVAFYSRLGYAPFATQMIRDNEDERVWP